MAYWDPTTDKMSAEQRERRLARIDSVLRVAVVVLCVLFFCACLLGALYA